MVQEIYKLSPEWEARKSRLEQVCRKALIVYTDGADADERVRSVDESRSTNRLEKCFIQEHLDPGIIASCTLITTHKFSERTHRNACSSLVLLSPASFAKSYRLFVYYSPFMYFDFQYAEISDCVYNSPYGHVFVIFPSAISVLYLPLIRCMRLLFFRGPMALPILHTLQPPDYDRTKFSHISILIFVLVNTFSSRTSFQLLVQPEYYSLRTLVLCPGYLRWSGLSSAPNNTTSSMRNTHCVFSRTL